MCRLQESRARATAVGCVDSVDRWQQGPLIAPAWAGPTRTALSHSVFRVLTEARGPIIADSDGPATRKVLNFGPSEHRAQDVGLNAASGDVGQVFELLAFRGAHPAHDTNAALARSMRVVCCHASHASTPAKSRPSRLGVSGSPPPGRAQPRSEHMSPRRRPASPDVAIQAGG